MSLSLARRQSDAGIVYCIPEEPNLEDTIGSDISQKLSQRQANRRHSSVDDCRNMQSLTDIVDGVENSLQPSNLLSEDEESDSDSGFGGSNSTEGQTLNATDEEAW